MRSAQRRCAARWATRHFLVRRVRERSVLLFAVLPLIASLDCRLNFTSAFLLIMEGSLLPAIVLRRVFQLLGPRDSWTASQTCKRWRLIGFGTRRELRTLVVSDFYGDVIKEERFIEFPVFHRRDDLLGLTLVKTRFVKKLIQWLRKLFPNVAQLVFRNYVRRGLDPPGREYMRHPCRFHVFIINELMSLIGQSWPNLEMLDISGEVVDVRSLHQVRKWTNFKELRISGCDLNYNMLTHHYMVTEALTKTFWEFPLAALRMSNVEFTFDMTFKKMTMFKALKNKSLRPSWLTEFFKEAINLKTLQIECCFLHDEHMELVGKLAKLEDLVLRNCLYVNDFSALAGLSSLRSLVIDFGGKGTEEQLCQIAKASKSWRRVIFNEVVDTVGDEFLRKFAEHCAENCCPLVEFEMNTEKADCVFFQRDWELRNTTAVGIQTVMRASPFLEIFGVRSGAIDDACLLELARCCPRIRRVSINQSDVTEEGVLQFYEALRLIRSQMYFGADCGAVVVEVRGTRCKKTLNG